MRRLLFSLLMFCVMPPGKTDRPLYRSPVAGTAGAFHDALSPPAAYQNVAAGVFQGG